jgi:uncharacterized protein YqeY
MPILDQLTNDMGAAMKSGQPERVSTLRLLRSAMSNERIKLGHDLTDEEALKVLQREAKQRRDSIEQYQSAGRSELAAKEQDELEIIESYLPAPLTEDELRDLVDAAVAELGSNAQMGAVIGKVLAKTGARAEGGTVSRLVRERLG